MLCRIGVFKNILSAALSTENAPKKRPIKLKLTSGHLQNWMSLEWGSKYRIIKQRQERGHFLLKAGMCLACLQREILENLENYLI